MSKLDCHYSGPNSKRFWKRVNKVGGPEGDALYLLGLTLQELEERVLFCLERQEDIARSKPR
jgi:hypothetical protein